MLLPQNAEVVSYINNALIESLHSNISYIVVTFFSVTILNPSGTDVVIVKNGRRVCGTGGCLANAPLHQNKSYFEFKIQSTGQ